MPGSAVRTKRRTEGAELKPPEVQLARVFGCRHEAADVGSPVRNPRQAGVDRDRHVRFQRLPRRVHVAGPEKRAIALHAGVAVAMERERALVAAIEQWPFPVHPDPRQPRSAVEAIALVRPPAVHAEIHHRLVIRPVALDRAIFRPAIVGRSSARHGLVRRARAGHGAAHAPSFDHRVKNHLVVERVKSVDRFRRIGEILFLPAELPVPRVPARWRELGAEVDQRITGQLLLAECPGHRHHFFGAGQRPVRLHVAERPQRRQLRIPGDPRVLTDDHGGILRGHDEHVERQRIAGRRQRAFAAGEIECTERVMDEHAPAVGPHQPLDGHAAAMRPELVAALAIAHAIHRPLAIELRAAFAKAEQRPLWQLKREARLLRAENQALDGLPFRVVDVDGRRIRGVADVQRAGPDPRQRVAPAAPRRRLSLRRGDQRAIIRHAASPGDRADGDPDRDRADRRDGNLHGHAGHANRRGLTADDDGMQRRADAGRGKVLQCISARGALWHRAILAARSATPAASGRRCIARGLRCSSFKYSRYSQSSRLAHGEPRRPRCYARVAPRAAVHADAILDLLYEDLPFRPLDSPGSRTSRVHISTAPPVRAGTEPSSSPRATPPTTRRTSSSSRRATAATMRHGSPRCDGRRPSGRRSSTR